MMDCHQHYCWCIWTQPKICQWALTHTHNYSPTLASFFLPHFSMLHLPSFIRYHFYYYTCLAFSPFILCFFLLSRSGFVSLWVKSVFEGHVGSGCLRERRSAGLVFCENTSALYRTMFVSHSAGMYIRLVCLHLTCIWCINNWLFHLQMFHSYISTSLLHVKSSCNAVQTLRTVDCQTQHAFCIDINSLY